MLAVNELCDQHKIGCHIKKFPTLLATVKQIDGSNKSYQIFLGSTQSSKMNLKDADIAKAASEITRNSLTIFVHTPYILNLSTLFELDGWQTQLFRKNIQGAVAMGCRGVVIHVGKSTKQVYKTAVETMRTNLMEFLQYATPECPILLETPAGQGTETLKKMEEFCEFVASFSDPRIRICLDTCHVFACGHNPIKYLNHLFTSYDGLLKLVHYNDSQEACGSCKDRHAQVGLGHIGLSTMTEIAELCTEHSVPMVIE